MRNIITCIIACLILTSCASSTTDREFKKYENEDVVLDTSIILKNYTSYNELNSSLDSSFTNAKFYNYNIDSLPLIQKEIKDTLSRLSIINIIGKKNFYKEDLDNYKIYQYKKINLMPDIQSFLVFVRPVPDFKKLVLININSQNKLVSGISLYQNYKGHDLLESKFISHNKIQISLKRNFPTDTYSGFLFISWMGYHEALTIMNFELDQNGKWKNSYFKKTEKEGNHFWFDK
jgi:hypothetical protein